MQGISDLKTDLTQEEHEPLKGEERLTRCPSRDLATQMSKRNRTNTSRQNLPGSIYL
jgi:hypothetical protein